MKTKSKMNPHHQFSIMVLDDKASWVSSLTYSVFYGNHEFAKLKQFFHVHVRAMPCISSTMKGTQNNDLCHFFTVADPGGGAGVV